MLPSTFYTSNQLHPVEMFHLSTYYSHFEAEVIHPYICAAHSQAELAGELGPGSVTFATSCSSLGDTLLFLIGTNYNHPEHKLPSPLSIPKLSVAVPLTCTTSVVGYISNKHPDCFVWQGGLFEQGLFVVLGRSYSKVKVVGSCGLEKNFIMMKHE
jgi:hypothetical protein